MTKNIDDLKNSNLSNELKKSIRDLRSRKSLPSYTFGEIGYVLFEIVKECIDDIKEEEFKRIG